MGQILSQIKWTTKNEKKPKFESREEYFIKNGGILLEKQIALSQGQRLAPGQLNVYSRMLRRLQATITRILLLELVTLEVSIKVPLKIVL